MKSYRVLLAAEAESQLAEAQEWWLENHGSEPDRLLEEFAQAVQILAEIPGAGPRFRRSKLPGVRRILLRRSQHWIYYVQDDQHALVYVLAVWSCRRGSEPPLSQT